MKVPAFASIAIILGFAALSIQAQEPAKERVINGGVLNGKATSLPKPDYPSDLREQGKGGTVNVDVIIDESGIVISATGSSAIKISAGAEGMMAEKEEVDAALVEAAVNAARLAQFSPTLLSGVPVKIRGTITYNFVPGEPAIIEDDAAKNDVLNGRAVSLPLPVYPPAARAVRAEGTVNVQIKVDETGKVVEARAVNGHPLLRNAAVKAALEAKFSPTMVEGHPKQFWGVLVYNFVGPEKIDQ